MEADIEISYSVNLKGNGVYIFVIEGAIKVVESHTLKKRDAIGIFKPDHCSLGRFEASQLLAIEVPMIND